MGGVSSGIPSHTSSPGWQPLVHTISVRQEEGPMTSHSRRAFLKTSGGVAATCTLGSDFAAAWSDALQTPSPQALKSFPLGSVRLTSGIFQQQEETNARYLDSLDVDRLLYSFRATAGITPAAKPYGGWEAPGCELRGHFN